jgi:predicted AAA+ superfamily ATPase
MKEVSDSLAGRIGFAELEPLSLYEINQHIDKKIETIDLLKVIERGFYPELWKEMNRNHFDYYQSYLKTYLDKFMI